MASISGINTKWWSNELWSNWAIELSGFGQFNWSTTTGEWRIRTPPQHMLSRLLNRKDARCGHSRQPSRQGEGGDAQRSNGAWRIWARGRDFAKSRISHESRNAHCRVSTCSVRPLSACQNQNVQNFVLSQNPNISMNFSGQRHCLASGMCKICAINIFRNIWPAMQA